MNKNREKKTRTGRCNGDRGASLTEGAIVAPVFFLLLFAIIEFGITFRDKLTFEAAAQRGARMGAIQGNSLGADQEILQDVVYFLDIGDTVEDVQIIIYKAKGNAAIPTPSCLAGISEAEECNVYTPGDELSDSNFGCLGTGTLDDAYCPLERSVDGTQQECIGIYLSGYHPFFTGFFGDGLNFKTNTVARIEPQEFGDPDTTVAPCKGAKVSTK